MTFHALGDMPVSRVVTRQTVELRVLRDVGLHLLVDLGVAYVTTLLQATVCRQVHRGMGLMTFGTFCQLGSVDLAVAGLTLRKNIFVFYFSRTIVMECFVTSLTVYSVFAPLILQEVKEVAMTAPALVCLEGLNLFVVRRGNLSLFGRLSRSWFRMQKGTKAKRNEY
jgi:hypothetical protein